MELVRVVHHIRIADAEDRRQARKAATACALNVGEAAGRISGADKRRVFAIARGECVEVVAAVELSGAKGGSSAADVQRVVELGSRVSAMLYRLS